MPDLIARLRKQRGYVMPEEWALFEEAATAIEQLSRERDRRNKVDPVTRLHNLCDGLADQRGGSPYSAEAWEQQDAAYREKCMELSTAKAQIEQLQRALRGVAIRQVIDDRYYECLVCGMQWCAGEEKHAAGCLAAIAERQTSGD